MSGTPAETATAPELLEARRCAATAAIIAMAGEGAIAVVDGATVGPGALLGVRLAHVAIASFALVWLAWRPPAIRVAEITFALVAIPFLVVLLVSEIELAARGNPRDHGSWYKLVILGVALLAPADPRLPSVLALALGAQKVALHFVLGVAPASPGEPWITLIFAVIAVGMLVARARRRELVAHAARVEAYAAALERVTRLLLGVRDRANTPLQTIAVAAAIMKRRCGDQQRVADAMDRAVRRLRRLSKALQRASRSFERTTHA